MFSNDDVLCHAKSFQFHEDSFDNLLIIGSGFCSERCFSCAKKLKLFSDFSSIKFCVSILS